MRRGNSENKERRNRQRLRNPGKPKPHSADPRIRLKGRDPTLPIAIRRQNLSLQELEDFEDESVA